MYQKEIEEQSTVKKNQNSNSNIENNQQFNDINNHNHNENSSTRKLSNENSKKGVNPLGKKLSREQVENLTPLERVIRYNSMISNYKEAKPYQKENKQEYQKENKQESVETPTKNLNQVQQYENLEQTQQKKPKFYSFSDFKRSQNRQKSLKNHRLQSTEKKNKEKLFYERDNDEDIHQEQNSNTKFNQNNNDDNDNNNKNVQLGAIEKQNFEQILSKLGQQMNDIDSCINRVNNNSNNNNSIKEGLDTISEHKITQESQQNSSILDQSASKLLSRSDYQQFMFQKQKQLQERSLTQSPTKQYNNSSQNQSFQSFQSAAKIPEEFWQMNNNDSILRKYRYLTDQGFMENKTFNMIMGLKPKQSLQKVKISRNSHIKIGEKDTPEQILHRYLYNKGEKPSKNQTIQQTLRNRELDLLSKKFKDSNQNQNQNQKNISSLPQIQQPNLSQFENKFKYMKYFQHNKEILEADQKHLENTQNQVINGQNNSQNDLNLSKYSMKSSILHNIANENNRLYRGQTKIEDPNSTLKNYLKGNPGVIQEAQFEGEENGNTFQRYDAKYKNKLQDVFNEEYERNFNPNFNKSRLVENMTPQLRRSVRSESAGKFADKISFRPQKSALKYSAGSHNNTSYTEGDQNTNNNRNGNRLSSLYDIQTGQRPQNNSFYNLKNTRSLSYNNTPMRETSFSRGKHGSKCKRPCCLMKYRQSQVRDIVINPEFDIQIPYNRLQESKQNKQYQNEQKQQIESKYYSLYDHQMEQQSRETMALLESVFDKNKSYNKDEITSQLSAFKKKYSALAEIQNSLINKLKKQFSHYQEFNIPEDDFLHEYKSTSQC